jgi:hypothetical protein
MLSVTQTIVFLGGVLVSNLVGDWRTELISNKGQLSTVWAQNMVESFKALLEKNDQLVWWSGLKPADLVGGLGSLETLIAIEGFMVRGFLVYAVLSYAVFAGGVMRAMCEVFDIYVLRLKKKKTDPAAAAKKKDDFVTPDTVDESKKTPAKKKNSSSPTKKSTPTKKTISSPKQISSPNKDVSETAKGGSGRRTSRSQSPTKKAADVDEPPVTPRRSTRNSGVKVVDSESEVTPATPRRRGRR